MVASFELFWLITMIYICYFVNLEYCQHLLKTSLFFNLAAILKQMLAVVVYETVLHLLLDHAPPLLAKFAYSGKHRNTWLHYVTIVRLNEVSLDLGFFIPILIRQLRLFLKPFDGLHYRIYSYHGTCAPYSCRAMHNYRGWSYSRFIWCSPLFYTSQ